MRYLVVGILILSALGVNAQGNVMSSRTLNLKSITPTTKQVSPELAKATSEKMKAHPEYGINPYHTQCHDCEEVLDKRTINSRYYIQQGTKAKGFVVQQSYGPLHYKDQQGRWITLDPRLKTSASNSAYYQTELQPVNTFYDATDHSNGLLIDGVEFRYNKNISLYFEDEHQHRQAFGKADRTKTTVGDDGSYTTDVWKDIDMEEVYEQNGIETNYHINKRLALPSSKGWLVFEDHFVVPEGCRLIEDPWRGKRMEDGTWAGAYVLVNSNDRILARINQSYFLDTRGFAVPGRYRLQIIKNTAVLSLLVPASFLENTETQYPVKIDPYVSGFDSIGAFQVLTNLPPVPNIYGAQMAFSNIGLGCPHNLTIAVPGKCKLYDAYVDLEYRTSDDSICVSTPPDGAFICTRLNTVQHVKTPCNTFTYVPVFVANSSPYNGVITSDSTKVPGAKALYMDYATYDFVKCIAPQCPDYSLDFTLYNHSNRCPDNCSFVCAMGNYWGMSITGRLVEDSIILDKDTVCAGSVIHLTTIPSWGVPPYTYTWSTNATDTITTDNPNSGTPYQCTVTDACGVTAESNLAQVETRPSPTTAAGTDHVICQGQQATVGGSPTAPAGDTILWTGAAAYTQSWISNASDQNPTITPPPDSAGTYIFYVRAADPLCSRTDTIQVTVEPPPHATIAPDPAKICQGSSIDLSTTATYSTYLWSTGATTPSITVTTPGTYSVTITDTAGCTGTSNVDTATVFPIPVFTISANPDTTINFGDSTILSSSIDLNGSNVQSYTWSPAASSSCASCPEPTVKPATRQYYTLEVTSTDGCVNKDSILIIVHYPNKYWIANAFSPNQDGFNDKFYIRKESGVTVTEFRVFDRWGNLVHDAALKPWDGNSPTGTAEPQEVYTYYFSLQFADGHKEVAKGNVTLIR